MPTAGTTLKRLMWVAGKKNKSAYALTGLIIILCLFSACGFEKEYRIDYGKDRGLYGNAQDSYRPGQKVSLSFAEKDADPDTEYAFFLDDDPVNSTYYEGKGYIITFIMPDHDAKLECRKQEKVSEDTEPVKVIRADKEDIPCTEESDEGSLSDEELKELSDEVNEEFGGYPGYIFTSPGEMRQKGEPVEGEESAPTDEKERKVTFTEGEVYDDTYVLRYYGEDTDFHRESREFELKLEKLPGGFIEISNAPADWTGKEDAAGEYGAILRMYYRELYDGYPGDSKCDELGFPESFKLFSGDFYKERGHFNDHFGYCLKDINGDGEDELFIGAIPDDIVTFKGFMQLWTMGDEGPVSTYSAGLGDDPVLVSGNKIAISRQPNAFEGYKYRMYLEPGKTSLLMDLGATLSGENTALGPGNYKCRKYSSEGGWSDCSFEEYDAISVAKDPLTIDWKPFSDIEK